MKIDSTATKISDFFIKQFSNTPEGITNLKLQKVLYFAYVWNLKLYSTKLFDDDIEAWEYGTKIKSQYDRFKAFRKNTINDDIVETNITLIPKQTTELLNMVWGIYCKYSIGYLIDIIRAGPPWINAYKTESGIITDRDIDDYYTNERLATYLPEDIELPENIIVTQNNDGINMVVRFIAFENIDSE